MNSHFSSSRRPRRAAAGFTLAEVLVGATLFTVVALAVGLTLQHAFRVITIARYEERANNVLRVLADQFQTSVINESAPPDPSDPKKDFFRTTTPTGVGMGWSKQLQTFVYPSASATVSVGDYIAGTAAGLLVPLNTTGENSGLAPIAKVLRHVRYVNSTSGQALADGSAAPSESAGVLIRADFSVEFTILGKPRVLVVSALRNLNPSDK